MLTHLHMLLCPHLTPSALAPHLLTPSLVPHLLTPSLTPHPNHSSHILPISPPSLHSHNPPNLTRLLALLNPSQSVPPRQV